jgi:phage tail-like protein
MNESVPFLKSSELLSLAVDHYNCYPGELATYFIRFRVPDQPRVSLQFAMPKVMEVESYQFPPGIPDTLPSLAEIDQELIILIPLNTHFEVGQAYELKIQVRVNTFGVNQYLLAEASLINGDADILAAETLQLAVFGKAKSLRHLPDIYDSDDFTSRFLMLFESFWGPIEKQIDQIEYYFDPDLTPPGFIPWLASWLGLRVDPALPLDRVRTLLKNAMMLYQYRGTYQALHTYLEIYTEGDVDILEQRAKNFVLGDETSLGVDIALGSENQPNTLAVNLRLPETELQRMKYSEDMYLRKMKAIIRTMVPAHTVINLNCAFYAQQG